MGNEDDRISFSNSFWGPDNKGFDVLLQRIKRSKRMGEEVCQLLKERASIEEEYGKRMAKLAKNFTILKEDKGYPKLFITSSLTDSLDVIRNELERTARTHLDLSQDLKSKLAIPLGEFVDSQTAVRKNHQRIMDRAIQLKTTQEMYVAKCRDRFEQKFQEVENLEIQLRQLPPSTPSKEVEKLRVKRERSQLQLKQADLDYKQACEKFQEVEANWRADMTACCVDFEKLEEDRYLFLRAHFWKYANFLSDSCVLNDQSSERIRVSLEQCNFEQDLALFISSYSTGTEIPEPVAYHGLESKFSKISLGPYEESETSRSSQKPLGQQFAFQQAQPDNRASQPIANERSFAYQNQDSSVMDSTFLYDPFEVQDKTTVLFTVKVLYDYKGQAREELDIQKDQIIPVVATHEDGWWEGLGFENGRRRKGLFPSNFCQHLG